MAKTHRRLVAKLIGLPETELYAAMRKQWNDSHGRPTSESGSQWKPHAAKTKEAGDGAMARAVEKHQSPAESRCRDTHGGKRVSDIVLALPERALTILPGFPPMDRRQTHEEGSRRESSVESFASRTARRSCFVRSW